MADCSLLEGLVERVGKLEDAVRDTRSSFEERVQDVQRAFDERARALELEMANGLIAAHCDALVLRVRRELESQLEARLELMRQELTQHFLDRLAAVPAVQATSETTAEDDGGRGPLLNITVAHRSSSSSRSRIMEEEEEDKKEEPLGGEVMLEVRASDTLGAVKRKAHAQLGVWYRFSALGNDGADDALPALERCSLYAASAVRGDPALDERCTVGACHLLEGSLLILQSEQRTAELPPAPTAAAAGATGPGISSHSVSEGAEEASDNYCCNERLNFTVVHQCGGEVMVEVRASETVEVVKTRAHSQLDFWYRFSSLGDCNSGEQLPLPPAEQCFLGVDDAPGPGRRLEENRQLRACGLEDGARLVLWGAA